MPPSGGTKTPKLSSSNNVSQNIRVYHIQKPNDAKTAAIRQEIKRHKLKEQERLKEEQQKMAEESNKKEEKAEEEEEEEVQDPQERLKALEDRLQVLTEQKHKLFQLLKNILHEDEKKRAAEAEKRRLQEAQKAAEMQQQLQNGRMDTESPVAMSGSLLQNRVPYQMNKPPAMELPGGSAVSAIAAARGKGPVPSSSASQTQRPYSYGPGMNTTQGYLSQQHSQMMPVMPVTSHLLPHPQPHLQSQMGLLGHNPYSPHPPQVTRPAPVRPSSTPSSNIAPSSSLSRGQK